MDIRADDMSVRSLAYVHCCQRTIRLLFASPPFLTHDRSRSIHTLRAHCAVCRQAADVCLSSRVSIPDTSFTLCARSRFDRHRVDADAADSGLAASSPIVASRWAARSDRKFERGLIEVDPASQ